MNFRLTESNVQEVIFEARHPNEFRTAHGIEERTLRFSHRLGGADMKEVWFEGIHLNYGQIDLKNRFSAEVVNDTPLIEMHFSLSGNSNFVSKSFPKQPFNFTSRQHNIVYSPNIEGTLQVEQSGLNKIFEIHLTEQYFKKLVNQECLLFMNMAESIEKKQIAFMGKQNHPITARMNAVISDISNCDKTGTLKRLFLEAKVLELLMLQVEQFEQSDQTVTGKFLNEYDVEKLHYAKFLIENNLANPYSLMDLSRKIGLNEFKLKKGFRDQFQTTVFGYIYTLRMEQAHRSLLDTNKSIMEISEEVGYKNAHHFTSAFKRKYNVLPSQLRK